MIAAKTKPTKGKKVVGDDDLEGDDDDDEESEVQSESKAKSKPEADSSNMGNDMDEWLKKLQQTNRANDLTALNNGDPKNGGRMNSSQINQVFSFDESMVSDEPP